jgi:hypothetical protein
MVRDMTDGFKEVGTRAATDDRTLGVTGLTVANKVSVERTGQVDVKGSPDEECNEHDGTSVDGRVLDSPYDTQESDRR